MSTRKMNLYLNPEISAIHSRKATPRKAKISLARGCFIIINRYLFQNVYSALKKVPKLYFRKYRNASRGKDSPTF